MKRASATEVGKVALRVVALVGGGYAAAAGLVAFASVGLPTFTGLSRSDAVVLSACLGYVLYLALAVWIAAERSLWRACFGPAILSGAGFGLAYVVAPYVSGG